MNDRKARQEMAKEEARVKEFNKKILSAKTVGDVLAVLQEFKTELIKSPSLVGLLKQKISPNILNDDRVKSSLKFIKERFKERFPQEAESRGVLKMAEKYPFAEYQEQLMAYREKEKAKSQAKAEVAQKTGKSTILVVPKAIGPKNR